MELIWKYFFVCVVLFTSSCCQECDTKYIDAVRAFNEFNLSVELKEKTESESKKYDSRLDSTELELKLENNTETEDYRRLVYKYQQLQQEQQSHINALVEDSDGKIWGILNGYFKEFGKENHISLLMGGTGNGTILYADENKDMTDKFIEYANKKYEGE